jgi:nitric oxide reductase subunit B
MTETTTKRGFLLSRGWIQAVILVFLFGFFVLGFLAFRTYTGEPPIPGKVIDPDGHLLFTRTNIMAGQASFLRNGLMEYGSIFGHGAYLGPDYTADYLHRAALLSIDFYTSLGSDRARTATINDYKTNRYDSATDTLTFTDAQAHGFQALKKYYQAFFAEPTTKYGLRAAAITDAAEARDLTAFFAWSAWCASALRPGLQYSYINNWPPEPLVDNHPTADTVAGACFLWLRY